MYSVSWTSPDGFFGQDEYATKEEAREIERQYIRQGCKTLVIEIINNSAFPVNLQTQEEVI